MANKQITDLTEATAPSANTDVMPIVTNIATTPVTKKITWANVLVAIRTGLGTILNGLTEDTAPDVSADFITSYDTSAAAAKKVKYSVASDRIEKSFGVEVLSATSALTTGDGKKYVPIPYTLNGYNVTRLQAILFAKSTSGTPTIQIARGRQSSPTSAHTFADMLSTRITIDANEFNSNDAATAYVIDTANDDLATGDILRVDIDTAGTGATGLYITFGVVKP